MVAMGQDDDDDDDDAVLQVLFSAMPKMEWYPPAQLRRKTVRRIPFPPLSKPLR
jgi:hypothetical protein